jgi:hypothetical protein
MRLGFDPFAAEADAPALHDATVDLLASREHGAADHGGAALDAFDGATPDSAPAPDGTLLVDTLLVDTSPDLVKPDLALPPLDLGVDLPPAPVGTWSTIPALPSAVARHRHEAVWAAGKLIIWGGHNNIGS